MNKDIVKGKWKQLKGNLQEKWGEFTDSDLDQINGEQEKLLGKIQENYGVIQNNTGRKLKKFESMIK